VSQLLALSIAVTVSLFLSTSISVVMMTPLRGVLNQLCPGSGATSFWMSFTTVMLYVTPLLFTLLFLGTVIVTNMVNIVRTALAASLFGSFAALLVVGYQIARARPVPR
jgi:spore maturation protein SpmB